VYSKFQTAIICEILVQSLRNKDFIAPKQTNYLNIVTHLLRSDEIFILFQSEASLLAVGHFLYHAMLIHQRNCQNMASSSVETRIQYGELL